MNRLSAVRILRVVETVALLALIVSAHHDKAGTTSYTFSFIDIQFAVLWQLNSVATVSTTVVGYICSLVATLLSFEKRKLTLFRWSLLMSGLAILGTVSEALRWVVPHSVCFQFHFGVILVVVDWMLELARSPARPPVSPTPGGTVRQ